MNERLPVPFVVGLPRSGTTLLRMMLDAHSTLAIPPETRFGPAIEAFERGGARAAVEAIVGNEPWGDYGLSAEEFARRVESRRPDGVADVLRTFYELYAEQRGKSRWGDKSPHYLGRMDYIQELLPEARFVHVVRDGRDVALSTIATWFGPHDVAAVARRWSRWLDLGRRQAGNLRHYVELRYEDLVRETPAALRQVCEFAELEWEPAMLDYHRGAERRLATEMRDTRGADRAVSGEERLAIHHLLTRPPQTDRVERWRREMSDADVETFHRIAGGTLETFGYATR